MATISAVLNAKGRQVFTIPPSASAYDAVRRMVDKGVGSLLVVEDDRVLGIVSERDYLRKVVVWGDSKPDQPVTEIMTSKVTSVRPDQTVDECMSLMTEKRIRHLPVLENGKLVGLLSIGDVLKHMLSEKDFMIRNLENYIAEG